MRGKSTRIALQEKQKMKNAVANIPSSQFVFETKELIQEIFSHVLDLVTVAQVCKLWVEVAQKEAEKEAYPYLGWVKEGLFEGGLFEEYLGPLDDPCEVAVMKELWF